MKKLFSLLLIFVFISCSEEPDFPDSTIGGGGTGWLIDRTKIFDGGPGKDGIPALENPDMASIGSSDLDILTDEDLVLVYKSGSVVKAYAHPILDWHEIINDEINGEHIAITYCPLTGTGIGWGREINSEVTTFGVSGLLFETNLIPYDRLTDSNWSQMYNKCVNGSLSGRQPEFFNLTQMTFGALKKAFPNAEVTTSNTGHNRRYGLYPYGSYRTNSSTLFPISNTDDRLHPKDLVRGVEVNGKFKAYGFSETESKFVIKDTFEGEEVVVYGDKERGILVSFLAEEIDGTPLEFTPFGSSSSEVIFIDQLGNQWNMFGRAVQGPNAGLRMEVPYSYIGYWLAWATFYPGIELYEQ